MPRKSFEELREEALEEAPKEGIEIAENSATMTAFASDTASYGQDYRWDIRKRSRNEVQEEAARFIGYEITEMARRHPFYVLTDEDEELSLEPSLVIGRDDTEELYRAFILVDRLQRGFTDKRPDEEFDGTNFVEPNRFPDPLDFDSMPEYQSAALQESGTLEPDNIGVLNQNEVLVVNDDWIRYRNGEKPETIDEEVYSLLRDLGVGYR